MRRFTLTLGVAIIILIAVAYLVINSIIAVVEGLVSLVVLAVIFLIGYLIVKTWTRK